MASEQELPKQLQELLDEIDTAGGDKRILLLREALPLIEASYPELWALLQFNLGVALSDSNSQNLEEAIAAYRATLLVYTRERDAEAWATTQYNLGLAYRNRLQGEPEQNLDEAITAYQAALLGYTYQHSPERWAVVQNNLGNAYRSRLRGDPAQNMAAAIAAYQGALLVFTRERDLKRWATIQKNLGHAYRRLLPGVANHNKEEVISAYQAALSVYTREQNPEEWAVMQANLGNAYAYRVRGEAPQNLEEAIAAYRAALLVYTQEHYPDSWATVQNNLGAAYLKRQRGEPAQNLEQAIAACQAALSVHTREQSPEDWAMTQINLSAIYAKRIRGEAAQNLEEAIAAGRAALSVCTRKQHPEAWAKTQSNLGTVYVNRLRGDVAQNIEEAITAFRAALRVYTLAHYPRDWAATQNNLGLAYRNRLRGKPGWNIEQAIAAFRAALRVYTADDLPDDWAMTQGNLGTAYAHRLRGTLAQNVEKTISAYQAALSIYSRDHYSERWAVSQHNLGTAYAKRPRGERIQNVKKAIGAYQAALLVRTCAHYPNDCRATNERLGHLLYDEKCYPEAQAAYQEAHEALRLLRGETLQEESRRRLAQSNAELYAHLIHCCLELHDTAAAATYALSGKSRSLTELLAGDAQALDQLVGQDPALAAEWEPVRQLQAELDSLLATLGRPPYPGDSRPAEERQAAILEDIGALRQSINQHTDTLLFRYPALAAVRPLPDFPVEQAQELSGELNGVPLVEYVRHAGGWAAFVVLPTHTHHVALDPNLGDLLLDDVMSVATGKLWMEAGHATQSAALERLHAWLIAPLQAHLPKSGELVLAPTQLLHLVPFQALLSPQGSYLGQDYALSFVPSLATLRVLHEQHRQSGPTDSATAHRLLSVAHPGDPDRGTAYLPNVLPEAAAVRACFARFAKTVELLDADALPERVYEAARQPFGIVHIGCHGSSDLNNPLNSALLLAAGTQLSVNDIRLRLRLRGHPLVTLSACETGQTLPEQGDEATGLSWAFLAAGASAVVASLWSVPDNSTRQLFELFYQQRQQARVSDAEALRRAIAQLRQQQGAYARWPYHWAAFQVMGLPVPTT